jgi:hypothetical protein
MPKRSVRALARLSRILGLAAKANCCPSDWRHLSDRPQPPPSGGEKTRKGLTGSADPASRIRHIFRFSVKALMEKMYVLSD